MVEITLFTYDRPHWKTERFLHELVSLGHKPVGIAASPFLNLGLPPSARSSVKHKPRHPKYLARRYGIDYVVCPHEDVPGTDLGVIGGARLLPSRVIDRFPRGIINIHPGLLPENRGLSNIARAMRDGLHQGVTAHLIDEHIDAGRALCEYRLGLTPDDTVWDITEMLMDMQVMCLVQAVVMARDRLLGQRLPHDTGYEPPMPLEEEQRIFDEWDRRARG